MASIRLNRNREIVVVFREGGQLLSFIKRDSCCFSCYIIGEHKRRTWQPLWLAQGWTVTISPSYLNLLLNLTNFYNSYFLNILTILSFLTTTRTSFPLPFPLLFLIYYIIWLLNLLPTSLSPSSLRPLSTIYFFLHYYRHYYLLSHQNNYYLYSI